MDREHCRRCGARLTPESRACPKCACRVPRTWVASPCRECGAPVGTDENRCQACGSLRPFSCSVCGDPIDLAPGAFAPAFYLVPTEELPYGALSPKGEPVCPNHLVLRCSGCGHLFYKVEMEYRITAWDRKPPDSKWGAPVTVARGEQMCRRCAAAHPEPPRPGSSATRLAVRWLAVGVLLWLLALVLREVLAR